MAADYDTRGARSVNDFIVEIDHTRSFQELHFRAADIAGSYHFDFVCFVRLPLKNASEVSTNILFGNVPPDWLADDESALPKLIAHAVRKTRDGINFLHLSLDTDDRREWADSQQDSYLFEELAAHARYACFFPVYSAAGGRGIAAYFGAGGPTAGRQMFELNYLSALLFDKYNKLSVSEDRATRLSKREVECLHWTAAGKTSAEIATILDLSEHTINNYLVAVCQKLNSVNRTHAVAKALRQGIIG